MTIPIGNRRQHLRRAQELLQTGQSENLKYAALELRLCLEAMTYDKLRSFEKYLSKSILERNWQPPQLLKAMTQLDGNADQSVSLYMGPPYVEGVKPKDDEYQLVGEHKAFGHRWLSKNYNKLGSLLHVQSSSGNGGDECREYLLALAAEIEEAQTGALLGMWFNQVISFRCDLCQEVCTVSAYYARTMRRATCLNERCQLEYEASWEGEQITLTPLIAKIQCKGCGESIPVQQRHLAEGLTVACPACRSDHIFRCRWEYGMVAPQAGRGADTGE